MGALIQCPHCKQLYGLNDEQVPQYAGQTIACTQCKQSFAVPADLAQQPSPLVEPAQTQSADGSAATQPGDTLGKEVESPDVTLYEAEPQETGATPEAPPDVAAEAPTAAAASAPTESQPQPPVQAAATEAVEPEPVPAAAAAPPVAPAPVLPSVLPPRPHRIPPGQRGTMSQQPQAHHVPPPAYPSSAAPPSLAPLPTAPPPADHAPSPSTPVGEQQSNGLAVASVVCGAVGLIPFLFAIPSTLGLVLGIMGLRKTQDPQVGGKTTAVTGISLSGAGFLIFLLSLPLMLSAMSNSQETANRVKCQQNMKTIGQALRHYASADGGAFPLRLEDLMLAENLPSDVFVCPASNDTPAPGDTLQARAQNLNSGAHLSYVYVGQRQTSATATPSTVVLYEPLFDHGNGCNFLYGDGHVDFLPEPDAQKIITRLQGGTVPPHE